MPGHVTYVDGKCTCCAYGYHVDLDFLNFCNDLEAGSTLRDLKKIQRTKRNLRKSMEIMLSSQEGPKSDPNSSPPERMDPRAAERLLHMVDYEQSATHNILRHIDSSVTAVTSYREDGEGWRQGPSASDDAHAGNTMALQMGYNRYEQPQSRSGPVLNREDSITSLSSDSTMSSEAHLYQAECYQGQQHLSRSTKTTTTKRVENPVLEMATAEMKHYSTTSSAQLMDNGRIPTEFSHSFDRKRVENPVLEMATAEMKHYSTTSSAQLMDNGRSPTEFSHSFDRKQPFEPHTTTAPSLPRPSQDDDEASTQYLRESMTTSLQRIKILEQQVKTIPILQVRISVLKEEKRLLSMQLKASQTMSRSQTVPSVQEHEQHPIHLSHPRHPQKPTSSIGVGDHSVLEPYNLQSNLSTGYTTRDNETDFAIYSREFLKDERLAISESQTVNRSFLQESHQDSSYSTALFPQVSQTLIQSHLRIDPTPKRSSPTIMTKTIGVGEGNVFEDPKLQVRDKEVRTLIIGPNSGVTKRNVGIECRVSTRDVGVSFRCDDVKPETRTVGVNVNYDTSGIFTSLDFKGETQLRMALQSVLHRSVRSVGINCVLQATTADNGTMTEVHSGVSVGCGDEDHNVDVEVRRISVKRSVAVAAKPDVEHKYVGTEADWVLDASTNTYQANMFDQAVMTDKQKLNFASTNTEVTLTHPASIQTEQSVFLRMDQVKFAGSNTEHVARHSTGTVTDITPTYTTATNTTIVARHSTGTLTDTNTANNVASRSTGTLTDTTTTNNVASRSTGTLTDTTTTNNVASRSTGTLTDTTTTKAAATNTETVTRQSTGMVTDLEATSNVTRHSTGTRTDITTTHTASTSTAANVSELNQEAYYRTNIIALDEQSSQDTTRAQDRGTTVDKTDAMLIHGTELQETTTIVDMATHGQGNSELENSLLSTASHSKDSSHFDDSSRYYSSLKVFNASSTLSHDHDSSHGPTYVPRQIDISKHGRKEFKQGDGRSHEVVTSTRESIDQTNTIISQADIWRQENNMSIQENMGKINMIFNHENMSTRQSQNSSPDIPEDRFSETVVEHFLLTKDGKKLISEETIATSSAGTNRTFKQFTDNNLQTPESVTDNFCESLTRSRTEADDVDSDWSKTDARSEVVIDSTGPNLGKSTLDDSLFEASRGIHAYTVDTSSESVHFSGKIGKNMSKDSRQATARTDTMSPAEGIWDLRRAGSVEDFMPNDIRRYMSLDPYSTSASSISTGDSAYKSFNEHTSISSSQSSSSSSRSKTNSFKLSHAFNENKAEDDSSLKKMQALEILNSLMKDTTGQVEVGEMEKRWREQFGSGQHFSDYNMSVSSSSSSPEFSVNVLQDLDPSRIDLTFSATQERVATREGSMTSEGGNWSEAVAGNEAGVGDEAGGGDGVATYAEDSYGSLDRQTAHLKSIIKQKSATQSCSARKGITFAETVTGGYELSDEVRNACRTLATYLTDSTSIQTKELNSSQDVVRQEWFQLSSYKLSSASHVETFLSTIKEMSQRLLNYIVNLTDANGNTAIHYCVSHCNFEIASVLLDSKVCDTNKRNKAGFTPIMLTGLVTVQKQQHWDIVRRVLSLGDINAKATQTQQTALMLAASHGRTEMVRLLTEVGASMNLQDEDGSTALMCACEHGYLDVVNYLLLQPGLEVNVQDNEGSTALNIAMETGHKDIGVVLYKHLNFSKPSSPGGNKKRKGPSCPT